MTALEASAIATTTLAFVVSPPVLLGLLVWNFGVLSAVQLTVRLIGAYSPRSTVISAMLLTLAVLPIAALFLFLTTLIMDDALLPGLRARGVLYLQAYVFQQRLLLFPLAIVATGLVGFVIIRATLRFRRTMSAVAAAAGIGVLAAPWVVFLQLPT